jgi:hypothetical protein
MGFFDRFRKPQGAEPPAAGHLVPEIVAAYGLKKAKPYEPSLMLDWFEGTHGALRFAVQESGTGIVAYLGDIVEITEIYLTRVPAGTKLPRDGSPQRLDRIAGPEGAALASQWVLAAHPSGDFDYPQLRLPEVLHGLPRLSPHVTEIAIYENLRGLSFNATRSITRPDFERALEIAAAVVTALQRATPAP